MHILKKVRLYYDTIKYLKPVQIYGRLWFKFHRPICVSRLCKVVRRQKEGVRGKFIQRCEHFFPPDTFEFLGVKCTMKGGVNWNDQSFDKLWLYNLHYFDDLSAVGNESKNAAHRVLIDHWIKNNPRGAGIGWESYPLSLRIINWIKWDIQTGSLTTHHLLSLFEQAAWLEKKIEYHLKGNHLIANAKALIFSGLYFSGKIADRWLKKGCQILNRELEEQILDDGGHFERSPMYHNIIIEDLLDLLALPMLYPGMISDRNMNLWQTKVHSMIRAMEVMAHPDGEIAFFNDAAFGVANSVSEIKKIAGSLIPFGLFSPVQSRVQSLASSGYYKFLNKTISLIMDAGDIGPDYLPAHAHADTLSFELSVGTQRVFVNSGTSVYGNSSKRIRQRRTLSHNTITVDDQDSSEVWSGFRVAKRAKVNQVEVLCSEEKLSLSATHDGYRRLNDKIDHRRTWQLSDWELVIIDELSGNGKHVIRIYFHVHPDLSILPYNESGFKLTDSNGCLLTLLEMDGIFDQTLMDATYCPQFGVEKRNCCIMGKRSMTLPARIITRMRFEE